MLYSALSSAFTLLYSTLAAGGAFVRFSAARSRPLCVSVPSPARVSLAGDETCLRPAAIFDQDSGAALMMMSDAGASSVLPDRAAAGLGSRQALCWHTDTTRLDSTPSI